MSTVENPPILDQEQADLAEVCRLVSQGKRVTDPTLRTRITQRSETVQARMTAKFGVVDQAIDLIREGRDEDEDE